MQFGSDEHGIPEQSANPRISLVVFSFNFGAFIGLCLESLVRQTLHPFEIIVCDDCSTDDSWGIIEQYKVKFPSLFRIFRHESNIGHIKNGIFGKEQVRGELMSIIDGDDLWLPEKLQLEWEVLRQNPKAMTAYSGVVLIDEAGNRIGAWTDEAGVQPPSGDVFVETFAKQFFPNTRSLFRNPLIYTKVLREIEIHDVSERIIHADWNLKLNLAARYEVAYSGRNLVEYRQHGSSIHRAQANALYESARYVIARNISLLRGRTDGEIERALNGTNALLQKLAAQIDEPARLFSKSHVYPPRLLLNSLPKSGTNLLTKFMALLPGLQSSGLHLGNSTLESRAPADQQAAPVGVDMPTMAPVHLLDDVFGRLQPGEFLSGHLPYSRELEACMVANDLKMVLMLRDPRDVVASHASYIAETPGHPFHEYYAGLNRDEQVLASINGAEYNGVRLLSIAERLRSVLQWKGRLQVHTVTFEELVGPPGAGSSDDQRAAIEKLAAFLNVELTDFALQQLVEGLFGGSKTFRKGQIGSWKTDLEKHHVAAIESIAGDALQELGYRDSGSAHESAFRPAPEASLEAAPDGANLVFLVSQPRSGSTLLQRVLGAHQAIHTLGEPWVMLHPAYALRKNGIQTAYDAQLARMGLEDFMESLPGGRADYVAGIRSMTSHWYRKALENTGKSIFLDKTPRYYHIVPELNEIFPESTLVLLFRNPLSVLSSILKTWVGKNWARLQLHRRDILEAPALLVDALDRLGDRVHVIHYERFVNDPEAELKKLCAKIGVAFDPAMLNYGAKPAPRGRMGDSVGIQKYDRPELESLDKWKTTFREPIYRLLAEITLALTGKAVIDRMGYDAHELERDLRQLPVHATRIPRQELIAMIAALQLSPDVVERIRPLFEPYLEIAPSSNTHGQAEPARAGSAG